MEVLTESLDMEIEKEFVEKKPAKKRSKKKASRQPQYIDGRKLSKHEMEFEKIASEKFDTQLWLKRNGLIF